MDRILSYLEDSKISEYILFFWTVNTYVGELLVTAFLFILNLLAEIYVGTIESVAVFSHDLGLFIRENVDHLCILATYIEGIIDQSVKTFLNSCWKVCNLIVDICGAFCGVIWLIIEHIAATLLIFMCAVQFLGNFINELVCCLPRSLGYLLLNVVNSLSGLRLSALIPWKIPYQAGWEFILGLCIIYALYLKYKNIVNIVVLAVNTTYNFTKLTVYKLWIGDFVIRSIEETPQNYRDTCVVCLEKPKKVIYMPCRHFCICKTCDKRLRRTPGHVCPLCRQRIRSSILVYD